MKNFKTIALLLILIMLLCGFTGETPVPDSSSDNEPLDYSNAENWIVFAEKEDTDADFFFIAPTVSTGETYNMTLEDPSVLTSFLVQTNVFRDIYGTHCRTFSPVYRQMTTAIFDLPVEEWEPYREFAYQDVSAAFQYYLENENNGRPIVLMGFSQGAEMGIMLMEDFFEDDQLSSQLVAAYFIGWPITPEMAAEFPQLKMAQGEGDTGVIIAFDCETPEVTESFLYPIGQKVLSINPLNWKTDSTPADKSLNKGSRLLNGRGEVKREATELCGAYIDPDRGVLKVTDIDAADYKPVLPIFTPGVLHVYDSQLFYQNLKENAELRLENYLSEHDLDR